MAPRETKPDWTLTLNGRAWCSDCASTRRFLDRHEVGYRYIDINADAQGAARVMELADGNRSVPTLVFPNDEVLIEPSQRELRAALGIPAPEKRWWWPF